MKRMTELQGHRSAGFGEMWFKPSNGNSTKTLCSLLGNVSLIAPRGPPSFKVLCLSPVTLGRRCEIPRDNEEGLTLSPLAGKCQLLRFLAEAGGKGLFPDVGLPLSVRVSRAS